MSTDPEELDSIKAAKALWSRRSIDTSEECDALCRRLARGLLEGEIIIEDRQSWRDRDEKLKEFESEFKITDRVFKAAKLEAREARSEAARSNAKAKIAEYDLRMERESAKRAKADIVAAKSVLLRNEVKRRATRAQTRMVRRARAPSLAVSRARRAAKR